MKAHASRALRPIVLLVAIVLVHPAVARAEAAPPLVGEAASRTTSAGIEVSGWAAGSCGDVELFVILDGRVVLRGGPLRSTPSVAARYPDAPGAATSGFDVPLSLEQLGAGLRRLRIEARSASCGTSIPLFDKRLRVPPVPPRPVAAGEAAFLLAALGLAASAGYGLSRLPAHPSRIENLQGWVFLSWFASAAAIVAGPRLARAILPLKPGLLSALANWDGGWYTLIAERGFDREQAFEFFPLLPALLRIARLAHLPLPLAGALISLAASLCAVAFLRRALPQRDLPILLLFSLPYSFFYSAVYTEPLFLLFGAGLLVSLAEDRAGVSFLSSALGALTRPQGALLAVLSGGQLLRRRTAAALWGVAGSVAAFGGWCAYMGWRTGDPLRFHAAAVWFGRSRHFSLGRLIEHGRMALAEGQTDAVANMIFLGLILAAAAGLAAERRFEAAAFSLAVLALPMATNSTTSLCRYALGAFPALLYLGEKLPPGRRATAFVLVSTAIKLAFAFEFGRGWYMG